MSEGEVARLALAIEALSKKSDTQYDELRDRTNRQHEDNQKQSSADREEFRRAISSQQATFSEAMQLQRNANQEALNKQFILQVATDSKLDQCIADTASRLGKLEETVEVLKKFRWQTLAGLTTFLYLLDKIGPLLKH